MQTDINVFNIQSDSRTLKDYGRLHMDGELKMKGKKPKGHVVQFDCFHCFQ